MQAEWAKSRARANRWTEEVLLIKEEMRRTLTFLQWRAGWWDSKPSEWVGVTPQLKEGLQAYAHRQAEQQRNLATHFRRLWDNPLTDLGTASESHLTPHTDTDDGDRSNNGQNSNADNANDANDDDDNDDDDDDDDNGSAGEDGAGDFDEDMYDDIATEI